MPKIICNDPGNLTGSVGSVEFVLGVASVPEDHPLLDHFLGLPEVFDVSEDDESPEPVTEPDEDPSDAPDPDAPADEFDALTDEELDEAYATSVAGNHSSRNGKLKALRALAADES